jgi:hypothetical protein
MSAALKHDEKRPTFGQRPRREYPDKALNPDDMTLIRSPDTPGELSRPFSRSRRTEGIPDQHGDSSMRLSVDCSGSHRRDKS